MNASNFKNGKSESKEIVGILPQVIPFFLLLIVIGGLLAFEIGNQKTSSRLLRTSDLLLKELNTAELKISECVANIRGYIITKNIDYIGHLRSDRDDYHRALTNVEELAQSEKSKEAIPGLHLSLEEITTYSNKLLQLEKQGIDTVELVQRKIGKELLADIKDKLEFIRSEEKAIQEQHEAQSVHSANRALMITIASLLIAFIWSLKNLLHNNRYYFQLKQSELKIKEAERRFRGLLESANDCIFIFNKDGLITFFNDQVKMRYGHEQTELIGSPIEMLIPEFQKHLITQTQPVEMKSRKKDGTLFPVEVSFSSAFSSTGEVAAIVRDITSRKIREERERVLVQMSGILTSLDQVKTLRQIAKTCSHEVADWCCFQIDGVEERIFCYGARYVEAGEKEIPLEYLKIHKNEAKIIKHLPDDPNSSAMVLPVKVRDMKRGLFILVSVSRTFDEDDLRFARDVVHRAALAMENAELHKISQESIKQRELIVSIVSHDLKNPLQAIKLGVQMSERILASKSLDEIRKKLTKRLEQIANSNNQALRLIGDLLDVTKIHTGGLSIKKKEVFSTSLMEQAYQGIQPMAEVKGIQLSKEQRYEGIIFCDEERMQQVLTNILGNALKFTPQGGRISIGMDKKDDNILIWISDTGPGIAPEERPFFFPKFWNASSQEKENLGLGLTIAKGIIEKHGGKIWADSKEGEGSTFYIELPTGPNESVQ
jgi:PAS domain S-box-containing protein